MQSTQKTIKTVSGLSSCSAKQAISLSFAKRFHSSCKRHAKRLRRTTLLSTSATMRQIKHQENFFLSFRTRFELRDEALQAYAVPPDILLCFSSFCTEIRSGRFRAPIICKLLAMLCTISFTTMRVWIGIWKNHLLQGWATKKSCLHWI